MPTFLQTVDKLCQASRDKNINPYDSIEWPETLDPDQWCFSPELISIYGTQTYEQLTEQEKKRLSFCETVNFFSLNIHGEMPLVEGLAQRLHKSDTKEITPYLHHFLDEENKHMVYFGGFCMRYAGKVYRDKKLVFPREYAPGEADFLFYVKVLIFEEISIEHNLRLSKDRRLPPIVRQINLMHYVEESRHLAFGRLQVKRLFQRYSTKWSRETLQGVSDYLKVYLESTWKEYYNPDVYRDVGLAEPSRVQEAAFVLPNSVKRRDEISKKCVDYLVGNHILGDLAL